MIDLASYLFFVMTAATVIAVPGVVMAVSLRAGTTTNLSGLCRDDLAPNPR